MLYFGSTVAVPWMSVNTTSTSEAEAEARIIARNMFWEGITVLERYKTVILIVEYVQQTFWRHCYYIKSFTWPDFGFRTWVVVMRHANVSVSKGMKWKLLSHLYILAPLSIAQVAASWKSNGALLLSVSPCLLWIRISGVPQFRWKPSSCCIMLVSCQYSCMDLRYGL